MTIESKVLALLSLLAVMLFATLFPGGLEKVLAAGEPGHSSIEWQPVDSPEMIAAEVFELVNAERQKVGLKSLTAMPQLTQIAHRRSRDMAERDYFSHRDPETGALLFVELYAEKNLMGGGENLFLTQGQAEQIPETAVAWWMESSSHRRNMLDPSFRRAGVGVVIQDSRVYITQVFLPDQD